MKRFANIFPTVAGLILVAMATVQIVGNQGAITLQPADPILELPSRYLFWGLAIAELAVAAICLFSIAERLKHMMVFWLAAYLVLFRLGLFCTGVHSVTAYLGTMSATFGLSPGTIDLLFSAGAGFLWCGSGALLFVRAQPRDEELRRQVEDSPQRPSKRVHRSTSQGLAAE